MRKLLALLMLGLWLITANGRAHQQANPEIILSQQQIFAIVSNTLEALEHSYLFPKNTLLARKTLRYQLLSGELYQLNHPTQLAQRLGYLLRQTIGDNYLEVVEKKTSLVLASERKESADAQGKFVSLKADRLDGNIGYLKFNQYSGWSLAKQDIDQAFHYLQGVQALIIDLTEAEQVPNSLAQYLMSFFIAPGEILGTIENRQQQSSEVLFAKEQPGYAQLQQNFPLYILQSGFVAGGWEFFSYTLKHFDKAVILGEQTIGQAYLTKEVNVSEYFAIRMPYAQFKHPMTNSNWQQYGVTADFDIAAERALELAYQLATRHLALVD